MQIISNIQISLKTGDNGECPFCNGKGYIKCKPESDMLDGLSLNVDDIQVGCTWCHGTGKAKDHYQKELYPGANDNWRCHNKRLKEDHNND